jgi:sulfonate transport system substrate-binding protein
MGWVEADYAKDGIPVRWLYSASGNKATELLASDSSDFVSMGGSAVLLARTNGVPIKIVYVFSKPEWTAVVVPESSPIKQLTDLKGVKVAAARGTDTYFFLLRALKDVGLGLRDIELVHLQHSDGWLALQRGNVDAWAGLDPFMASAELRANARLIYRNIEYITPGVLSTSDAFLAKHPEHVRRVLALYERARTWVIEHKQETAAIIAAEAKVELDVATRQLVERTVFDGRDVGVPGEALRKSLEAIVPILVEQKIVRPGADPAKALRELVDPAPAQAVIK